MPNTLIVSYDDTSGDIPVLIIGYRDDKNRAIEIINFYKGDEAKELWSKLTVRPKIEG